MQRGDQLPVFQLDFATIGILTCYDGWFPESFRVLSLKSAELLVWINGRRGSVEDFIVRSVTFQSHVAMITANQAYGGGTMIANWPSQILARAPDRQEAYLTATLNLEATRKARRNSRNFRQRRPELYGELVRPLQETRGGEERRAESRERRAESGSGERGAESGERREQGAESGERGAKSGETMGG